jgi:vacuolar-type H+-ATPase subunit E/Vma4
MMAGRGCAGYRERSGSAWRVAVTYEGLIKSMDDSASEQVQQVKNNAEKEAEAITQEAIQKSESIKTTLMSEARRKAELERNREQYITREEMKADSVRVREGLLEQAFLAASKKAEKTRERPDYREILKNLLTEGMAKLGSGEIQIHVDRRDESLCREIASELKLTLTIFPDLTTAGGVEIHTRDDAIVVFNTIESRLERAKEVIKQEIFATIERG